MATASIDTTNPTTETMLDRYPLLTSEQLDVAVNSCHRTYLEWRHQPLQARAERIAALGKTLQTYREQLATLMTAEMGKLLSQSYQEVDLCSAICAYTAEHGPAFLADEHRALEDGRKGVITRSPIGVVYGIQPWNFPAYQVVRYSVASLMAGNGVLLKHAANVTGTGQLLARLYREAGMPDHLFQALVITHDQSDEVIAHSLVRGVTLTGSDTAGRHVAAKAGQALKKTVMELGSNDAYVVLEDADIEHAVTQCVQGRIYNNGETCVAAKRFVVSAKVYQAFRDGFVAAMEGIRFGDPMGSDVDLGPIARADLRDTLHEQVMGSVDRGARVLCGGAPVRGTGYFYPATVLDNVKGGQPAYDDELFGPVASLIRAGSDSEAMRIANDSRYGLGGGIFSRDTERAVELARREFDTGMVFVNGFGAATPSMPFGGVKDSGWGREHGGFGMREFVNEKAIVVSPM